MRDFNESKSVCFNFSTKVTADLKKFSLEKENQKFKAVAFTNLNPFKKLQTHFFKVLTLFLFAEFRSHFVLSSLVGIFAHARANFFPLPLNLSLFCASKKILPSDVTVDRATQRK